MLTGGCREPSRLRVLALTGFHPYAFRHLRLLFSVVLSLGSYPSERTFFRSMILIILEFMGIEFRHADSG